MKVTKFNPYPNQVLNFLDKAANKLMRLLRVSVDGLLSCFMPTTLEWQTPLTYLTKNAAALLFYTILVLLTLLPGLVGFLIWIPICSSRSVYRISASDITAQSQQYIYDNKDYAKVNTSPNDTKFQSTSQKFAKSNFTFATMNVCFLQDFLSRYNNLSHTSRRAKLIGECLAKNQSKYLNSPNDENCHQKTQNEEGKLHDTNTYHNGTESTQTKVHQIIVNDKQVNIDVTTLTEFPQTDFLFFQETWDTTLAEVLNSHLHEIYPYIVYDVGEEGWKENTYCNNSGLMLASKHPITHVRFHRFQHCYFYDNLNSKGLLQVKVDLGLKNGKQYIGLLYTTHLQVYPGESPVRRKQMDDIITWCHQFRSEVVAPHEYVAFDVLGGDFNFDNSSPVDRHDYSHALFSEFKDICRIKAGLDHPFTIGTDMRHIPLYDDLISTPEGLKMALDDPVLRQYYIMDGNLEEHVSAKSSHLLAKVDEQGNVIAHPLGGRRRLDYILFRESDNVIPTAFNNVTLLAGLTDHIAVSLTIQIT